MMSDSNLPHRSNPDSLLSTQAALDDSVHSNLPTPSGLTPNTRSEAEAAFNFNATQQVSSAAAVDPPPHETSSPVLSSANHGPRRRPLAPPRSGSNNYLEALKENIARAKDAIPPVDPVSGVVVGEAAAGTQATRGLDKQQGWSDQDFKRSLQQRLVTGEQGQGYDSTSAKK